MKLGFMRIAGLLVIVTMLSLSLVGCGEDKDDKDFDYDYYTRPTGFDRHGYDLAGYDQAGFDRRGGTFPGRVWRISRQTDRRNPRSSAG